MSSVPVLFAALFLLLVSSFLLFLPTQKPAYAQAADKNNSQVVTLESKSDQRTFLVQLNWTQAKEGDVDATNSTFKIRFIEPETGKELEQMTYDFIVIDSANGRELVHRQSQTATIQTIAFSAEGPYTIHIANIDGLGEGAKFDIKVTPEFAPPVFAVVSAAGIAFATIFGAKFRKGL